MAEATLTTKGQITLPKKIRDALSLQPGDRISFTLEAPGRVRMEHDALSVLELKGLLKFRRRKPVLLEEMDRAIRKRGSGR